MAYRVPMQWVGLKGPRGSRVRPYRVPVGQWVGVPYRVPVGQGVGLILRWMNEGGSNF